MSQSLFTFVLSTENNELINVLSVISIINYYFVIESRLSFYFANNCVVYEALLVLKMAANLFTKYLL